MEGNKRQRKAKKGKVQKEYKKRRRKKESERRQPEISAPHFLNQHCCVWQAQPAFRFGRLPSLFWQAAHFPLHAPSFFPCLGIWVRPFPCPALFVFGKRHLHIWCAQAF
jgi:hypothetical protein